MLWKGGLGGEAPQKLNAFLLERCQYFSTHFIPLNIYPLMYSLSLSSFFSPQPLAFAAPLCFALTLSSLSAALWRPDLNYRL